MHRTALLLHYLSGFSYSEIADFLEVPVSTIKGRIQQGRLHLRETCSIDELRGAIMAGIDVRDEVQELVYQIVTQRTRNTASVSGVDNIVLFLGVPASMDILQSPDDEVVIEGSRSSVGLSEEDARQSAGAIELEIDQVEDFLQSGPHVGEIFAGTSSSSGRKPVAQASSWADTWASFRDRVGERADMLRSNDGFPDLAEGFTPWHDDLPSALKDAVRISVGRRKMEVLTIPRGLQSDRLNSILQINHSGDEWVQGGRSANPGSGMIALGARAV